MSGHPALAPHQAELVALLADQTLFLEGPAGAGKTTASVARLLRLLKKDAQTDAILFGDFILPTWAFRPLDSVMVKASKPYLPIVFRAFKQRSTHSKGG